MSASPPDIHIMVMSDSRVQQPTLPPHARTTTRQKPCKGCCMFTWFICFVAVAFTACCAHAFTNQSVCGRTQPWNATPSTGLAVLVSMSSVHVLWQGVCATLGCLFYASWLVLVLFCVQTATSLVSLVIIMLVCLSGEQRASTSTAMGICSNDPGVILEAAAICAALFVNLCFLWQRYRIILDWRAHCNAIVIHPTAARSHTTSARHTDRFPVAA